jgi:hypothetical protein
MRKVLVILLMIGFIIGTISVFEELTEEIPINQLDFSGGDLPEGGVGYEVPCGGGEGTGGGGGQPG